MMHTLYKKADGDSPWWMFVPGAGIFGKKPDVGRLGDLGLGRDGNIFAWNLIGNSITAGGVTAAATILAHKLAKAHVRSKAAKLHEAKVNALAPISAPNMASDIKAVGELRRIGVGNNNKKAGKDPEELVMQKTESMPKEAMWRSVLPLLATIPVSAGVYHWVKSELKDEHEEELNKEIAEQRNHLDKLYAKLLKARSSDDQLEKTANGPITAGYGLLMTSVGLMPILAGIGAYKYTKAHDEDIIKRKILEKQIMAQNLTNIPDTLEVVTGDDESIPTTRKEQKYIDELNKTVEELG